MASVPGGLGQDYSVGTGYDDSTTEATFGFGLQGLTEEQIPKTFELIQATLEAAAREGFPPSRIEAVLHSVELGKRETPSNMGLSLFGMLTSVWSQNVDLHKFMNLDALVTSFRQSLVEDPQFLQKKVSKYFLENQVCWITLLSPHCVLTPI